MINRQLEVKLQGSELQSTAKAGDVESLKKRLTLSEAACKAAKIKEGHLNDVRMSVNMLSHTACMQLTTRSEDLVY